MPVAALVREFRTIMAARAVVCEEGRGYVCAVMPSCQYGIDTRGKETYLLLFRWLHDGIIEYAWKDVKQVLHLIS